jgi:cytochrome c-type biogenesis protein CcmH/NrfG
LKRLLLACLLAAALPLPAQQPADLEAARQTIAAIQGLLKQRPNDAVLYFFLARFEGQLGNAQAAAAALEKVAELGDGYLPVREGGFVRVWTMRASRPRTRSSRRSCRAWTSRLPPSSSRTAR